MCERLLPFAKYFHQLGESSSWPDSLRRWVELGKYGHRADPKMLRGNRLAATLEHLDQFSGLCRLYGALLARNTPAPHFGARQAAGSVLDRPSGGPLAWILDDSS
jgi:hypothetical protein